MESNSSKRISSEFINLLWQQFIHKINSEWATKYTSYGTDINQLNSSIQFSRAVQQDMSTTLKQLGFNETVMNPLTLHHYFKAKGLSVNTKKGTLDIFSKYLGYDRWTDFVEKNPLLPANDTDTPIAIPSITTTETKANQPSSKPQRIMLTLGFAICLLAAFFAKKNFSFSTSDFSDVEQTYLTNLIENANQLEFSLYQSFPNIADTSLLYRYFVADGSAIQGIRGTLNRAKRNNRLLRVPPSLYELIDIQFISKSPSSILIETNEKWCTLWYDPETNKDERIYDVVNIQQYIIVKDDDAWKIKSNIYQGKATDIVD